MVRILQGPKVPIHKQTLPISKGGTSANNLIDAAKRLKIVTASMIDQPSGVIGLDSLGKVPTSKFSIGSRVNLDGPLEGIAGQTIQFFITDYDSFKTYTLNISAGSVSRVESLIQVTLPVIAQNVTLTVNGKPYVITCRVAGPLKPSITSPTANAVISTSYTFTASAFAQFGDSSTHLNSDWQVATDPSFTSIVKNATADAVNKVSWPVTGLALSTGYFSRVRYKASNGNYSDWSDTRIFTTMAGIVITGFTVANAGSGYTSVPTVTISGGGGSGATATAVMVSDGTVQQQTGTYYTINQQSYAYLIGYDYTSLPTVVSWSGAGISTYPTPTIQFATLYDFSGSPIPFSYNGTSLPDGTYTSNGSNALLGPIIAPVMQITVSGGVVVSSVVTNIGLTSHNGASCQFTFLHPTIPGSYIGTSIGTTTSPRKGVTISAIGGVSPTASTATLNYSGGGGNGSGSQAFSLGDIEPIYSNVAAYRVQSITLNNPGSGYTSTPTVTISGGGGSGATATVNT